MLLSEYERSLLAVVAVDVKAYNIIEGDCCEAVVGLHSASDPSRSPSSGLSQAGTGEGSHISASLLVHIREICVLAKDLHVCKN